MYNAQVYKAKILTFTVVLTWKPPGPTTICSPTKRDIIYANSVLSQQLQLLHKATLVSRWANTSLQQTQTTYKVYHHKSVRFDLTFAPGDYVCIKRPPLATFPSERLATEGYTKVLLGQLRSYRVLGLASEYVKYWQDRSVNIMSINLITKVNRANDDNVDSDDNDENDDNISIEGFRANIEA